MSRKTKTAAPKAAQNETSNEAEASTTAAQPAGGEGRVLKRKNRSRTPKPKDKEKPAQIAGAAGADAAQAEDTPTTTVASAAANTKGERKPRAKKEPKEPKEVVAKSLADLRVRFCAQLLAIGKSQGTARSYAADLTVACKHFGDNKLVAKLSRKEIEGYFASDRVTLTRDGQRRNQITIDKVVRVFRQVIEFAVAEGWVKESPLPDQERRSRKSMAAVATDAAAPGKEENGEAVA